MDLSLKEEMKSKLGLARLSKPALIGLTALIIMVAVAAGRMAIDTATATEIAVERAPQHEMPEGNVSADSEASSEVSPATVFVHVSGEVESPGLVELQEGSRVADAVDAADGPTGEADLDRLNLARKLEDGEHIHVPRKGDPEYEDRQPSIGDPAEPAQDPGGLVNVNTASASELETLPGIGPATASKIITDREANGPFSTIEELTRVAGIGEKKLETLKELVCV